MIFAAENIIDKNKMISKIRAKKMSVWIIIAITICIRARVAHMILAPFSALVLIIVLGTYEWGAFGKKVLLFFGKHSTNMWLVHMQFYMIFTPKLVFGSRNVFVIMFTLIGLSVETSYIIDFLYGFMIERLWKQNISC